MTFTKILIAGAFAAATSVTAALASEGKVEVGVLTCHQTDRTNLVVFSEAEYDCTFKPTKGAVETYTGKVQKVGIDLTIKKAETLKWGVFAPSTGVAAGGLAGGYGGVSADAALGVGGGAHVLVGGFEHSIALQPIALSGEEGVGVAAGIEGFKLEAK
jgi:hypothetical protein